MSYQKKFMILAIEEAKKAALEGECPIGAVIVKNDAVIAASHNMRESKNDVSSHAEIEALKAAGKKANNWRLDGCDLYVTLEPCPMCAGAIIQSRIKNVYYGADDPVCGACGSSINLFMEPKIKSGTCVFSGCEEAECKALMEDFFKSIR